MILCIGTTPAAQRVMVFRRLTIDAVNRAVTTLDGAAGKSVNVAKVLKALGERPVATGFLGGDRGEHLRALLKARGIELDFVKVAPHTRQCITLLDTSAGTQTELVEESQPVAPADYEELMHVIRRRVKGCRAVVMSGTITPGGPADLYFQGTQMAHEAGAIPVVDAQGAALARGARGEAGVGEAEPPGTGRDAGARTEGRGGGHVGHAGVVRARRAARSGHRRQRPGAGV